MQQPSAPFYSAARKLGLQARHPRRAGATLLELLLVLSVGVVIIAVAIGLLTQLDSQRRFKQAAEGVHALAFELQRSYLRSPYYFSGDTLPLALDDHLAAAGFTHPGFGATRSGSNPYALTHPYGGSLSVVADAFTPPGGALAYQSAEIRFEDLHGDACIHLTTVALPDVLRLARVSVQDGGTTQSFYPTSGQPFPVPSGGLTFPVSPADAEAACGAGAGNQVSWLLVGNAAGTP